MKKDIHPAYGPVVLSHRRGDRAADLMLTRSTLVAREGRPRVELDGATYPVVDVDVSAASHPFWTGRGRVVDTEGRVQAFERRYGAGRSGGGGR